MPCWVARISSSINLADQAFEVFGFGEIEDDRMIWGGSAAFVEGDASAGVGGSGGYCAFEVAPGDVVRTGASDKQASWADHADSAEVELFVAT